MSKRKCHLDFETRSVVPFGKSAGAKGVNVQQYAKHPTTEIRHACYAFNDGPVYHWHAWRGDPVPDDLLQAVTDGWIFGAHNAGFEQAIWEHIMVPVFGAPPLEMEQMDCTAARAAIMALPRSLEEAAEVMELPVLKDGEGHKVMMKVSKPRPPKKATKTRPAEDPNGIYWHEEPELMIRQGAYCEVDVIVERLLDGVLEPMTELQRQQWLRVHRANMRGVMIDTAFVEKALDVVAVIARGYDKRFSDLTNGKVKSANDLHSMKAWLADRGIDAEKMDKTAVIHLLKDHAEDETACAVMQLRQEAAKSSVAKLHRFLVLTDEQQRMLENFLFHAANTGRLGGRGAQLQNLPSRGGLKWWQALKCIEIILACSDPAWAIQIIEALYGEVPTALSSCLRACIMARPGTKLFVADFSNIEGRVGAWLAGETWKLRAFKAYDTPVLDADGNRIPCKDDGFKRKGADLYKITAGQILGISAWDVGKIERNVLGKVSDLSLLFGGGVGAYVSMGKNYNVDMSNYWDLIKATMDDQFIDKARWGWNKFGEKDAKRSDMTQEAWMASETVKCAWRDRHPAIIKAWSECETQSLQALLHPGKWFPVFGGKCAIGTKVIGGINFLIYRLPSGRRLYRAKASIASVKKFGKQSSEIRFWGVDSTTKKWKRMSTYGGDTFQSFVQATAYDMMDVGWANVEADGFEVNLSVHDELGAEGHPDRSLDDFINGMNRMREWAKGCPVSAAGYIADNYRKD